MRKSREYVASDIRRELAKYSNFACSICGAIPIVFHHIEEWSKKFSNAEEILIPICDKCHRGIHGEGGTLFSKNELYDYKANPKKPLLLSDKLPLERKKSYSFFVGSNFLAQGTSFSFFNLPNEHSLLSINGSESILRLSVLAEASNGKKTYLIKDNELLINTEDIWDMLYSRNSLKIWRMQEGRKTVFIDLAIKPDLIIVKAMHTTFDGKEFRIYRLRNPQQRQVDKIVDQVKRCEEIFLKEENKIDKSPRLGSSYNDIDIDELIKATRKQVLKNKLEGYLLFDYCDEFNWDEFYYLWVLQQVLDRSSVFGNRDIIDRDEPEQISRLRDKISDIKIRYEKEFNKLGNIVVEYDGFIFLRNVLI